VDFPAEKSVRLFNFTSYLKSPSNLPRKPPLGKSLAEVNPELAKQWHIENTY